MSQLNDNLTEILRQKNTYLLPENLKKDVTVLGVTGTLCDYITEVEVFDGDNNELYNTLDTATVNNLIIKRKNSTKWNT